MDYLLFQYDSKREANDLSKALSLLFLLPEEKIKAEDGWEASIRHKKGFTSLSIKQLLTYTACWSVGVPSITIVQLPKTFASDEKFIDSFGDNYLGTVSGKITKQSLLEHSIVLKNLQYTDYLYGWFQPNFHNLNERLKEAGLSDLELKELENLSIKSNNPIVKWIDKRKVTLEKKLKHYTPFIKRNY